MACILWLKSGSSAIRCWAIFSFFVGRDRLRAKVLGWDGTGLWIHAKRLEKGRFVRLGDGSSVTVELSMSELQLLLEGCKLIGKMPLSPARCRAKDFHLSRLPR
jgi:transposase